jgi:hypothetical protein
MTKISIGLRGWRFDESAVFTDGGEFRPLEEMPIDVRERLLRLNMLIDEPCDVCQLTIGAEDIGRCRPAAIVYGEPAHEVLVCDPHEPSFIYWYREAGGVELAGTDAFRSSFHQWIIAGNRAPPEYAGLEYVEEDPAAVPMPKSIAELTDELNHRFADQRRRIDLRTGEVGTVADHLETDG